MKIPLRPVDLDLENLLSTLDITPNDPILSTAPMHVSQLHFDEQAMSKLSTPIRFKGSLFVYKRKESMDEP